MAKGKVKILLVGAGVAGRELLGELRKSLGSYYSVVGFVDDSAKMQGKKIDGALVLGKTADLPSLIKRQKVEEVYIAIPSAEGKDIRRIVAAAAGSRVRFRIVPRTLEIVRGRVKLHQVRDVSVNDLFGRALLKREQRTFKREFGGKKILVTGAAGSIGSELCRQLVLFKPKHLLALDWWESGLYELEMELGCKCVIGDIREYERLSWIMHSLKPDIVFHAAAFKHVPLMQKYPEEAVKNNIFGTENVAKAAFEEKVRKVVNISTDKAADPVSIMGATKLLGEYIVSFYNKKGKTKYTSVRFGNVVGSYGSVVPVFEKQISNGGPVTVTSKNMTRFFMSIPEAVQLVLHACVEGRGGEVFVLQMGEQVKIVDLARLMILLAGFIPEEEVKIRYVGRRPGEKMSEILFSERERLQSTSNKAIYRIDKFGMGARGLQELLSGLRKASKVQDRQWIFKTLKKAFPNLQELDQ